jgi:hypothetical protein
MKTLCCLGVSGWFVDAPANADCMLNTSSDEKRTTSDTAMSSQRSTLLRCNCPLLKPNNGILVHGKLPRLHKAAK